MEGLIKSLPPALAKYNTAIDARGRPNCSGAPAKP
jgi:hypothetical protein